MLTNITNVFTQCIPRSQNSTIARTPRYTSARTPRYTSEQGNSYKSRISTRLRSDKKIKKIEALNHELHRAIINNSGIEKITEMLKKGADPNAWIQENYTYPMKCAINCGNLEVVKLLLKYKANIDGHFKCLESGNPYTNLTLAVMENKYDIVKLLLEQGADPNFQVRTCFYTALAQVAIEGNKEIAKLLIESGAKIEGRYDESPLYFAVGWHSSDNSVVKLLLEKGADPTYGSGYKQPCLEAIIYDNVEALSLLFSYDTKDILKNMIDEMMLTSAKYNSIKCMQMLLNKGYSINSHYFNNKGIRMTPLEMAIGNREQCSESEIKFILYLLDNGANIIYRKEQRYQPCFRAIQENNSEILLLLLRCSAEDKVKNIIDQMMLLVVKHNSVKCMQVLLDYGCDINGYYINDENMRITPLMMALSNLEQYSESEIKFIIYLLDNGANIISRKELDDQQCFRSIRDDNAEMLSFLLRIGTPDGFKNIIDKMMLQVVKRNSVKCMQVLLDYGCDINECYINDESIQMTPLIMAIGNREQCSESAIKFILYLLDNGANIVYSKEQLYQPCFRAIQANNSEILLLLLRRSAKDKVKNIIDQMILLVVKHNSVKFMQVLLDYGCDINGYYINDENMRRTPLMMALSNLEQYSESEIKFIIYLLDNGANIISRKELDDQQCFRSIRDDNAEMLSFLLKIGTTDGFKNIIDQMMLLVVKHNSVKCMQVLLDYGCDINEYYINDESIGITPLMMALDTEHYIKNRVCLIKYLLEKGADTNVKYKDSKGTTLIEKVIENNNLDIAFQLRKYGAQADETIVNKIINRYGFDPNVVKSLMVLATTVVKKSFKYSFDNLDIPTSLKLELEEK